jgi:hypothetical protein
LQYTAATYCRWRALFAKDKRLPVHRDNRLGKEELAKLAIARRQFVSFEESQRCGNFSRTQVHPVSAPVPHGTSRLARASNIQREDARRLQIPRRGEFISPLNLIVMHAD